jgi:hypothetical protein
LPEPETGLADDDQANEIYSGISQDSLRFNNLEHGPAELLSEEAKPKQAVFSRGECVPMCKLPMKIKVRAGEQRP